MFIYVIVNNESLKLYVGQHKGNNLQKYLRQKQAHARYGASERSYIYNAMRKYPKDVWSIHSLQELWTREELNYWEKFYIKLFHSQNPECGYNLASGGEGGNCPTISEETRKKLCDAARNRKPHLGWHHTEETKQKMRLRAIASGRKPIGNRGRVFTADWRRHIGEAQEGRHLTEEHKRRIGESVKRWRNANE